MMELEGSGRRVRSAAGQANRNRTSKLRFKRNKQAKAAVKAALLQAMVASVEDKVKDKRRRSERQNDPGDDVQGKLRIDAIFEGVLSDTEPLQE